MDANLNCGINDVSGIIAVDTTWTSEGGPIRITGVVQVADGVTLTIAAGTRVIGGGNGIEVFGNLIVNGTLEDPVLLDQVVIKQSGGIDSPCRRQKSEARRAGGRAMLAIDKVLKMSSDSGRASVVRSKSLSNS